MSWLKGLESDGTGPIGGNVGDPDGSGLGMKVFTGGGDEKTECRPEGGN